MDNDRVMAELPEDQLKDNYWTGNKMKILRVLVEGGRKTAAAEAAGVVQSYVSALLKDERFTNTMAKLKAQKNYLDVNVRLILWSEASTKIADAIRKKIQDTKDLDKLTLPQLIKLLEQAEGKLSEFSGNKTEDEKQKLSVILAEMKEGSDTKERMIELARELLNDPNAP